MPNDLYPCSLISPPVAPILVLYNSADFNNFTYVSVNSYKTSKKDTQNFIMQMIILTENHRLHVSEFSGLEKVHIDYCLTSISLKLSYFEK